jgi:P27 family predicted phage terminase small subunit
MPDFKRGNLSSLPVNQGRNRLTSGQKPNSEKQKKALVARSLLDELVVAELPAPSHFDAQETEMWNQTTKTLASVGVLTQLDAHLLAAWVESWCGYNKLRTSLKRDGDTLFNDRGNPCANPARAALHSELSMFTKISTQLGLDPRSRLELQKLTIGNRSMLQNMGSEDDGNETSHLKQIAGSF